jgi:hypothetical protein
MNWEDVCGVIAVIWMSGLMISVPVGIDAGSTVSKKIAISLFWPLVLLIVLARGLGEIWREGI